ncbi:metallophosphoesterase family protein [Agarilytica rhodophyticola]|uniref:metallophosphoesterase family protein n=1 Tax=Agarilytica rhodophyticola TaxID=1737490 RepID=UPI000B3410B8|nr:metallophosphoesterase family protein [Agarilytica rhodophyticola]
MKSKVGVIGDIHVEDIRLEIILNYLASEELDGIYATGDIVDGNGSVDRCCELLKIYSVISVLGNHDQWCLEEVNRHVDNASKKSHLELSTHSFLSSLPKTQIVDTVRGKAMLCHGLGESNMASVKDWDSVDSIFNNLELWALHRNSELKFVFNGHSHRPNVHTFSHLTVINAGALNNKEIACSAIVDFQNNKVRYYGVDELLSIFFWKEFDF